MSKTFETMCLVLLGAILLVQILSLVISTQLNPMRSQAAMWSGETFDYGRPFGSGQQGNDPLPNFDGNADCPGC